MCESLLSRLAPFAEPSSIILTILLSPSTMISQELFDETLLENEEVFDLSPDEALQETIEQFEKSNQSMQHLSVTHPRSEPGISERLERQAFTQDLNLLCRCVREDETIEIVEGTLEALVRLRETCTSLVCLGLLEQQNGL